MNDDIPADEDTETLRQRCLEAARIAFDDALVSGLCREGAWEAAVSAIRHAASCSPDLPDGLLLWCAARLLGDETSSHPDHASARRG